jgi:hypothetical protein
LRWQAVFGSSDYLEKIASLDSAVKNAKAGHQ